MSTTASADDMLSAIERSGYYPGIVADAVFSAIGSEPVVSYFVHHDAHFDPGMEVRRHMTVLALTPNRLVYSHTDEYPADENVPESGRKRRPPSRRSAARGFPRWRSPGSFPIRPATSAALPSRLRWC